MLAWGGCTSGSPLNPENVEIEVSISGSGVVYSPDATVGLSCRPSCTHGFIAAAESDRSVGEVINVGSNFEVSIGDKTVRPLQGVGQANAVASKRQIG